MKYFLIIFSIFFTSFSLTLDSHSNTVHKVKSGENLSVISSKYDVSIKDLKRHNNLNSNKIKIGQKLKIPSSSFDTDTGIHTVKNGDTLGGIANNFNLSSRDLIEYNNLENANIRIGQKIKIPPARNNINITSVISGKSELVGPELYVTYKVKKGDTLGEIAEDHNVSTANLRIKNNINGNNIRIGQVLTIPNKTKSSQQITTVDKIVKKPSLQKDVASDKNIYIVKSGDTLGHIANKIGLSSSDLMELNNLNSARLKIGQRITLPDNKKSELLVSDQKNNVNSEKITKPSTYTVRKGDNLGKIAQRFGVPLKNLKLANRINSNKIIIGQKLKIPGDDFIPESVNKVKYKVRSGDSLGLLARKFGTDVKTLKKLNNLSGSNIKTGSTLYVPDNGYRETNTSTGGSFTYKVVAGDTLGGISRKFGVSVRELKSVNNLRSSNIKIGQKLLIQSDTRELSSRTITKLQKYRVRSGDSLSEIARRFDTTTDNLKRANNLKNSKIKAGQTLRVPVTEKSYVTSASRSKYTKPGNNRSSNQLIQVAKKYLGAPYKFGGNSTRTGIDCSAYVKKVYSFFDIELPRTARDIYKEGEWVRKRDLEEGDLVFFRTYAKYPSHVGIYIGDDKFIHASSAKNKVTITNLNKNYYKKRYIGAKRIASSGMFYNDFTNKL